MMTVAQHIEQPFAHGTKLSYHTLSHSLTHRFYQPTEPMTPHLEKSHIGHKLAVCDPRVWESCAFPTLLYQEAGNQALFKVSS